MVLTADWGVDAGKTVKLLEPAAGAQPGDRVYLQVCHRHRHTI
jgi:hypothetical protein